MDDEKEIVDYEILENAIAWGIFKGGFYLSVFLFFGWIFLPFFEDIFREVARKIAESIFSSRIFIEIASAGNKIEFVKIFTQLIVISLCFMVPYGFFLKRWSSGERSYDSSWKGLLLILLFLLGLYLCATFFIIFNDGPALVTWVFLYVVFLILFFVCMSEYKNEKLNVYIKKLNFDNQTWRYFVLFISVVALFLFFNSLFSWLLMRRALEIPDFVWLVSELSIFIISLFLGLFFKIKK